MKILPNEWPGLITSIIKGVSDIVSTISGIIKNRKELKHKSTDKTK